jgi:hypothetical protein
MPSAICKWAYSSLAILASAGALALSVKITPLGSHDGVRRRRQMRGRLLMPAARQSSCRKIITMPTTDTPHTPVRSQGMPAQ